MSQDHLVEVPACQICGDANGTEMFRDPPFRVMRCPKCSLVYVTPRHADDQLHKVYGLDYWNSDEPKTRGYASYALDEHLYLKTFQRRLGLVAQHVPPTPLRVLDIGCAAGFFLRVMRENGHEVHGVELSPEIAHYAISSLGSDCIHVGTTADLAQSKPEYAPHSFDLVTLWDVVEHVPDPQELLRQAHSFLKPDGVLILETQNVHSSFARLLGRRWQHFKHEEHLYHFNPDTIRTLLQQSGFQVIRNTPAYGGKYVSMGFVAERAARISTLAGLLCKPLNLFKRAHLYLNLRDEMVVVARPTSLTNGTS